MKLRSLLLLLFLAAIASSVAIYRQFYMAAPEQQYRLQEIKKGEISQIVSANGTINPVSLVNVGTQVSGTVEKIHVNYNSKVAKGQILLELDDSLLAAQLKQSRANLQGAQATLELACANDARMKSLFSQEYVSRQELDTTTQARKVAEAQVALARATVEKDLANLAYSVIRSPVAGVVVDRSVDVGQTVAASLQTPTLFKIAQDLSRMQIDANFAEADIGNIRVGQTVRFTVDAFAGRNFQGEVKLIRLNSTTIQNVVTYDVVINVSNPDQILLPGMTAYVNIVVAARSDALLVPNAALRFKPTNSEAQKSAHPQDNVQKRGDGASKPRRDTLSGKIYLLENGRLKPVRVSLGITDNRNTEIIAGELKEGDQVVVADSHAEDKPKSSGGSRPPMRMF